MPLDRLGIYSEVAIYSWVVCNNHAELVHQIKCGRELLGRAIHFLDHFVGFGARTGSKTRWKGKIGVMEVLLQYGAVRVGAFRFQKHSRCGFLQEQCP